MFVWALAACQTATTTVSGQVVDIWDRPVAGATVMVVGGSDRPLTGDDGTYTLPQLEGVHLVKAGRKGFIQDHAEFDFAAGKAGGPSFRLYPKPEENGLHLVGSTGYQAIEHKIVHTVGSAIHNYRGIRSSSDVMAENTRPQVLFHTDLRHDEIMRLGLELRRLEYLREGELPSPMGRREVSVNLYVDAGAVPIDLQPLRSKTDYLITPTESLEPGFYAFQTQDMLTSSADQDTELAAIPEELRVVFPFEVR